MANSILSIHKLSHREFETLPSVLQEWSKMAYARLKSETQDFLLERLSDCQRMCQEIVSLLKRSSELPELGIYASKDPEGRIQAIMATWRRCHSIAILKIASCPWNISSGVDKGTFPVKGAGTSLIFKAINEAREQNLGLELTSLKSSTIFYERIGFRVDSRKKVVDGDITPMFLSHEQILEITTSV